MSQASTSHNSEVSSEKSNASRHAVIEDFPKENVLQDVTHSFAETIELKVKQLRRYIPALKVETNPEITGIFIEELVRGFVTNWIGHCRLLTGSLYSKKEVGKKALQIDGIVHDPKAGPPILQEGNFVLVHPAFCAGVIEIKMTYKYIKKKGEKGTFPGLIKLEHRLEEIHQRYLSHLPSCHVMSIVIADSDPGKIVASGYKNVKGEPVPYHAYDTVPLRPIFVLFRHNKGVYEPQFQAIENMIRAIYRLRTYTKYV